MGTHRWSFGPFEFDARERRLLRSGVLVATQPKPLIFPCMYQTLSSDLKASSQFDGPHRNGSCSCKSFNYALFLLGQRLSLRACGDRRKPDRLPTMDKLNRFLLPGRPSISGGYQLTYITQDGDLHIR